MIRESFGHEESMGRAFITGGTGFVGRNLVEQLLEENWQVVALHRHSSRIHPLQRPGVTLVEGSITDPDAVVEAMPEAPDAVFHLAASTNMWSPRNRQQTRINVDGTRNVVAAALQRKAGRLIHTSSMATFGIHRERITEQTQSTAADSWINYLRTKRLAELEVLEAVERGLDAVIVNPASIIGPYDRRNWGGIIRRIVRGKFPGFPPGQGSFCHVKQVVHAHIAAFQRGRRGEHYLLGGVDATFLEVARCVAENLDCRISQRVIPVWLLRLIGRISLWRSYATGKEPALTPEKAVLSSSRMVCSSDKAMRELGYRSTSLPVMIADCIRWLRDEKLLQPRRL